MEPEAVQRLIEAGLPNARVQVFSEDRTHFEAIVISDAFAGKRGVQRHQLVYRTLGALVGREIHALALTTMTPAEAQAGGAPTTDR